MKYTLLPRESDSCHYYKVNLHSHSLYSDGDISPEQIKERYMARGYSAVAFSDHQVFFQHNDLTDENFVALNAMEADVEEATDVPYRCKKTCHFNILAKTPDIEVAPFFYMTRMVKKALPVYGHLLKQDLNVTYQREYTPECINEMMKMARDAGFFVTYNHPTWSMENYPIYSKYTEMDAVEIRNYISVQHGFIEDDIHVYEDLLNLGHKITCVCADDNHAFASATDPYSDSFGGYTWIWADRLEYRALTKALEDGHFYCGGGSYKTDGPRFLSIEYDSETRKVVVETTPVRSINFGGDIRIAVGEQAGEDQTVTTTEFDVPPETKWFRIWLVDNRGYKAYTNAFFLEDLK